MQAIITLLRLPYWILMEKSDRALFHTDSPGYWHSFFISRLTGITNQMVEQAPSFDVIAQEVDDFTRNRILVAHNAHFDYTFLKQAFQRSGYSFQRKTLCTLRLSRKILPGLNLCTGQPLPHIGYFIKTCSSCGKWCGGSAGAFQVPAK